MAAPELTIQAGGGVAVQPAGQRHSSARSLDSFASGTFAGARVPTGQPDLIGTSPGENAGSFGCASGSSPESWGPLELSYLLGTSPPSGSCSKRDHGKPISAKKFWSRLLYDDLLDATEFQIGFLEIIKSEQRRSGKGAWSERQHEHAVTLPFDEFKSRFPPREIPFHRIVYFKHNGITVWEKPSKEQYRKEGSSWVDAEFGSMTLEPSEPVQAPSAGELAEDLPRKTESVSWELPEECWAIIRDNLGVRELCMLSRVCKYHRDSICHHRVWQSCHSRLFGSEADSSFNMSTIKRVCRRSELRAARWLEADRTETEFEFAGSTCIKVDESKVISADGTSIRLWSHVTGRRISKLQGQSSPVTCITCDNDLIVTGCAQHTIRLWGMDDLKFIRAIRGHNAPITDICMLNGMPLSSSEDGTIRFWDPYQAAPILALETDSVVNALAADEPSGRLTSAGWSLDVWDLATAQKLVQLANPFSEEEDDDLLFELVERSGGGVSPFTAISQNLSTLAAGALGTISLWDLRSASRVHHVDLNDDSKVIGLQMDDWKLLSAVEDSRTVSMYDIRMLWSNTSGMRQWPAPVLAFMAGSNVNCFQFHGGKLVVGADNAAHVWSFNNPNQLPSGENSDPQTGKTAKESTKKKKVPKRNSRYPKRTTR